MFTLWYGYFAWKEYRTSQIVQHEDNKDSDTTGESPQITSLKSKSNSPESIRGLSNSQESVTKFEAKGPERQSSLQGTIPSAPQRSHPQEMKPQSGASLPQQPLQPESPQSSDFKLQHRDRQTPHLQHQVENPDVEIKPKLHNRPNIASSPQNEPLLKFDKHDSLPKADSGLASDNQNINFLRSERDTGLNKQPIPHQSLFPRQTERVLPHDNSAQRIAPPSPIPPKLPASSVNNVNNM